MIISEGLIALDIDFEDKDSILTKMVDMLAKEGHILDKGQFLEDVKKREEQGHTDLGFGLALPHSRSKSVKELKVVFIRLKEGIKWKLGGGVVKLVFLLAVPYNAKEHIEFLSSLAEKLLDKNFLEELLVANQVRVAELINNIGGMQCT